MLGVEGHFEEKPLGSESLTCHMSYRYTVFPHAICLTTVHATAVVIAEEDTSISKVSVFIRN